MSTPAHFSRRQFVKSSALAAASLTLASRIRAAATATGAASGAAGPVTLRWLDEAPPRALAGASWGVPWPRGAVQPNTTFGLTAPDGAAVPVQSWPLATWPDGSLKWTAHALPADVPAAERFLLAPGAAEASGASRLTTREDAESITIETGVMTVVVAKGGAAIIRSVQRGKVETLRHGRLVCLRQDAPDAGESGVLRQEAFTGSITAVTLEQSGPVRAVVKVEGKHADSAGDRAWLPFVLRLYVHAGSDALRIMHTIVYDGDEYKDFIRGVGVRFDVALRDALHDRHVRFAGEGDGVFGEAVRGITGLRRDPGQAVREAQVAGRATPPLEQWDQRVTDRLQYIPAFGDWTLFQPNSDSFEIRKRTAPGHTWLHPEAGRRAAGLGYVGGPSGGVAFGIRNFWQSYPAQFDIRGATGDVAEVTMWVWAPDAPPMDLRFYHDGLGQDTYEKQYRGGLEITYEDYEPGFGRPEGVARTSELYVFALAATPERARIVELADAVRTPPFLTVTPEHLVSTQVFGGLFSLPDRSDPEKTKIEERLDFHFDYYVKQRDQHRWYGFWNYGDVMHTYDADRHVWRYDIGGFAWDNSELSTDIWLWLYYLRTGRADVFRFAEAMTRHTGEVDVHHLGRFAPLGSRHNVLHWGCSAKQLRISTAQNRRYYYYLTGDERVGDLMREQNEAHRTLVDIQPGRKLGPRGGPGGAAGSAGGRGSAVLGFGTDWGSAASAWLTEWERTGDPVIRDRLLNSMRTIGAQPRGFFTSQSRMNLDTGEFEIATDDRVGVSHLSAVFGLVEVCAELVQLVDDAGFRRAWLDYCELYNAPAEEQQKRLGRALQGVNLQQGHSRLTAFAGRQQNKPELAKRAWQEFYGGAGGIRRREEPSTRTIKGPDVLEPVDEAAWISTNGVAQWGLAAIQCLALAGDPPPAT
jgi:hypothetical protein